MKMKAKAYQRGRGSVIAAIIGENQYVGVVAM
jgi:hypothetical protein